MKRLIFLASYGLLCLSLLFGSGPACLSGEEEQEVSPDVNKAADIAQETAQEVTDSEETQALSLNKNAGQPSFAPLPGGNFDPSRMNYLPAKARINTTTVKSDAVLNLGVNGNETAKLVFYHGNRTSSYASATYNGLTIPPGTLMELLVNFAVMGISGYVMATSFSFVAVAVADDALGFVPDDIGIPIAGVVFLAASTVFIVSSANAARLTSQLDISGVPHSDRYFQNLQTTAQVAQSLYDHLVAKAMEKVSQFPRSGFICTAVCPSEGPLCLSKISQGVGVHFLPVIACHEALIMAMSNPLCPPSWNIDLCTYNTYP